MKRKMHSAVHPINEAVDEEDLINDDEFVKFAATTPQFSSSHQKLLRFSAVQQRDALPQIDDAF